MFTNNRICKLLNIDYPIVQAGMVWCSGWKLATAVSNSGGLGLIGAGSMTVDILREHIRKAKSATQRSFGVNLPLLKKEVEEYINVILEEKVKIVFTSAGNPATWTPILKENECTVIHVVSSAKFAVKAQQSGADAIVAEGFEAGGHNGREETTSFVLIPSVRSATDLPLIAAGGMYSGKSLLAAMALGAEGIQVGSRFAVAEESSSHAIFKEKVIEIKEGETRLVLKKLTPVRMITNAFYNRVAKAESEGADYEELKSLLGYGRSRMGIFEGNLEEGELEIGQVSSLLNHVEPARDIVKDIIDDYTTTLKNLNKSN